MGERKRKEKEAADKILMAGIVEKQRKKEEEERNKKLQEEKDALVKLQKEAETKLQTEKENQKDKKEGKAQTMKTDDLMKFPRWKREKIIREREEEAKKSLTSSVSETTSNGSAIPDDDDYQERIAEEIAWAQSMKKQQREADQSNERKPRISDPCANKSSDASIEKMKEKSKINRFEIEINGRKDAEKKKD